MKRINEKVRNKETHTLTAPDEASEPRKTAEIIDLMAVLKQSLQKGAGAARPQDRASCECASREKESRRG